MLTIITCTGRKDPRLNILTDSIYRNMCNCSVGPADVEWIIVDMLLWSSLEAAREERRRQVTAAVAGRFKVIHIWPKPTPWQGPTRLTSKDYFALCNARNTGLAYANHKHVAFLDDCICAGPEWMQWHIVAARQGVALAGSYKTVGNAKVVDGVVQGHDPMVAGYEDHRTKAKDPDFFIDGIASPVEAPGGGWLYGLNMSFPLDAALKVDGFDERYDGQAGVEDCDMGIRLTRAGCRVFFQPRCTVWQLSDTHEPVCGEDTHAQRTSVVKGPKEWKLKDGKMHYANERLIEILYEEPNRFMPKNPTGLNVLRKYAALGRDLPFLGGPTHDWRDGKPLREM